jgi:septum formation protein
MPAELAALLPSFRLPPQQHPTLLAWRKATAARREGAIGIVLGADTIVVIDDQVLNKPRDAAEAQDMLRQLSGRTHQVYTGVVAFPADRSRPPQLQLDVADVQMAALSDAEIVEYVATGEPLDKAGGYGIQGLGGRFVQQVVGSYTCVVGLPLGLTHQVLVATGLQGLADPAVAFQRWLADNGKGNPACTAP